MTRAKATAEWVFGLLVGTLTGFALAMIFVQPDMITPESAARLWVAVVGIGGATAVMVVRNWLAGRQAAPARRPDAKQDGTGE
jgi:hypothetical protein